MSAVVTASEGEKPRYSSCCVEENTGTHVLAADTKRFENGPAPMVQWQLRTLAPKKKREVVFVRTYLGEKSQDPRDFFSR